MAMVGREEALATLAEGHDQVARLIAKLTPEQASAPRTIGGGEWSALDLLDHVAAWEEAAVDAIADVRRGEVPWIEAVFAEGSEGIDRFNADRDTERRGLSPEAIRDRAGAAHVTLVGQIEALTDDEWGAEVPGRPERRRQLGNLLGSITGAPQRPFGHAFAHLPDLEAYVSSAH
jgi:hypothetical protein